MSGYLRKKKDDLRSMSKIHNMTLEDVPFDATKAKLKTIEVRLNDERRKSLKDGDELAFQRRSDGQILRTKVLAIRSYSTLDDLVKNENFIKTGGIYKDINDWRAAIDSYYSRADQNQYGLLAIEMNYEGEG